MHIKQTLASGAAAIGAARAATLSLAEACTVAHVQASLPANNTISGISFKTSSVTASAVNATSSIPGYCSIAVSYTHIGKSDNVNVQYWFPAPESYKKRYLSTGGGGFAINSGTQGFSTAVQYGSVAGSTDGGFGNFSTTLDEVVLLANNSLNWDALTMFGYQGIYELTRIGKAISESFYGLDATDKIYTYYQGCSEGGREGMSQLQKYGEEYDGIIPGAPAIRYAQQQVSHLHSNLVEETLDYFPPSCELTRVLTAIISACDPLDGLTDGVVSRTDLCKLNFNLNSTIGLSYSCSASRGGGGPSGGSSSTTPAVNGTVSAEAVAVAQTILDGLHTTDGKRAYLSFQPSGSFDDAATTYNNSTGEYEASISSIGGEFVAKFIQQLNQDSLTSLSGDTYDTLVDWINIAWTKFEKTLQTTNPDLTPFYKHGGKVLTYHGESDSSIPAGSSVWFHESVRRTMYPKASYNESISALGDWYRLFLVPGAGHCGTSQTQPNGPWPTNLLASLIDWVENGTKPITLAATHESGTYVNQSAEICAWPLRPYWTNSGNTFTCQYDQASIDTWMYDFNAYNRTMY